MRSDRCALSDRKHVLLSFMVDLQNRFANKQIMDKISVHTSDITMSWVNDLTTKMSYLISRTKTVNNISIIQIISYYFILNICNQRTLALSSSSFCLNFSMEYCFSSACSLQKHAYLPAVIWERKNIYSGQTPSLEHITRRHLGNTFRDGSCSPAGKSSAEREHAKWSFWTADLSYERASAVPSASISFCNFCRSLVTFPAEAPEQRAVHLTRSCVMTPGGIDWKTSKEEEWI